MTRNSLLRPVLQGGSHFRVIAPHGISWRKQNGAVVGFSGVKRSDGQEKP